MPESTLTLCQSWLYPPVRDFGFGLWAYVWCAKNQQPLKRTLFKNVRILHRHRTQKYAHFMTTRELNSISYVLTTSQAKCTSCNNGFLSRKLFQSLLEISFTQIVIRGSDPETGWFRIQFGPWIRIQDAKKTKKKRKIIFTFWTAGIYLWKARGFSLSLVVLHMSLLILQFWSKRLQIFQLQIFKFLSIKILG